MEAANGDGKRRRKSQWRDPEEDKYWEDPMPRQEVEQWIHRVKHECQIDVDDSFKRLEQRINMLERQIEEIKQALPPAAASGWTKGPAASGPVLRI